MYILLAVVLFLCILGALVVLRKARKKKASRKPLVRPPLSSALHEFRHLDTAIEPGPPGDIQKAYQAIERYTSTYKDLLAGNEARAPADFSEFVPDCGACEPNFPPIEHFLRNAMSSDVLYGYLVMGFEQNLETVSKTGMANPWGAGYLGEAALIAFRRTGELRFFTLYQRFFDRLMTVRDSELGYHDDYHDKQMNAWGAYNLGRNAGKPGLWVAHVTHFSVIVMPATGFARDILGNARFDSYRSWATSVIDFFEEAYEQFDVDYRNVDGADEKWYWRPLLDKYEATNHMHLQGQALLNVYAATGNDLYAERIRSFLRIFEDGVTIHDDGRASWNYSPYFQVANEKNGHISRQFSEYTWKGEITVPFLYEAKADGFDIRADVLAGVTSSIRDHVLKDGDYKLHVHPRHSRPISARDRKKASFIECGVSGFHAAADYDRRIAKQVVDIVVKSPELFPNAWFTDARLSRSYARLLPTAAKEIS